MNKYVLVFPGQGSQTVGMLADIAEQYSEVEATFQEASQALNYDLWAMTKNGPKESLDQTQHTQPALLAAGVAIWRIINARSAIKPSMLAGHSLGEYTALVAANALEFQDAIKLVAARGQYMQDAVPAGVGAMAAIIGLEDEKVSELCKQMISSTDEILAPANFNSVGQVVIAGHAAAVSRAINAAKDHGARMAIPIPVSVPSHSKLMEPAAVRLGQLLSTITLSSPSIPVINNVDVKQYTDENSIRDGLVRQLSMPVRWVETIQTFSQANVTHVVECGPGKVLTGLNKRIDSQLQCLATNDLNNLTQLLQQSV